MAVKAFTHTDFEQFISSLKYPPNPFQREILESIAFGSGNIQVSAVAGSGKTTMIEMIVKLVRFMESITQAKPLKVFAMAFNVTIREELSKRLSPYGVNVDNSNRLGNSVIKKHLEDSGEKAPKIDAQKYQDLASRVLNDVIGRQFETVERDDDGAPIMKSTWALKYGIASLAEKCLTAFVQPDNIDAMWWLAEHHSFDFKGAISEVETQVIEEVLPKLLRDGQRLWQDHRIISLSEQLALPVSEHMVFPKYDLVLVDEGQDLNIAQQAIAKRCIAEGGRIVIVGDARQAIMGFSGADDAAWWRMQKVYNTKLYALNITYRCPKLVADLARAIVPQLEARPDAPDGIIRQNISKLDFYGLLKPDTLILSRMNKDLVETFFELVKEKAKRNDGLTIQVIGRDISNALTEILKRIEKLHGFKYEDFELYVDRYIELEEERIKKMRSETRREESRNTLQDEIATLMMCHENFACKTIEEFKSKIESVFGGNEAEEAKRKQDLHSAVSLCTAHKSKGLEAERIIILAPDKMPLQREGQHAWQLVQEMNLLYVAITRSLSELFVIDGYLSVSPVEYDVEAAASATSEEQRFAALALDNDSIPGVNVDKILGIVSNEAEVKDTAMEETIENLPPTEDEAEIVAMNAINIDTLETIDKRLEKAHANLKRAIRYLRSAHEATEARDRKDYLISAERFSKDFDVETSRVNLPYSEALELLGEDNHRIFKWNNLHSRVYNLMDGRGNSAEVHNLAVKVLESFSKEAAPSITEVSEFPSLSIEEAADALYAPVQIEGFAEEAEGTPIPLRELFVYGLYRPAMYGTCPEGFVQDYVHPEKSQYTEIAAYERKLNREEMTRYEMQPISNNTWDVQIGEKVFTTGRIEWTVKEHLINGKLLLEVEIDGRKESQIEHQWSVTPKSAFADGLNPKPLSLGDLVLLNPDLPTDKGTHNRAIKVATLLQEAGLWDGKTPIRFDNAYETHKRVVGFEHLDLKKLILSEQDGEILVSLPSENSPSDEKAPEAAPVVETQIPPTEPVAWAKWMLANKERVVILDTETTDFQTNLPNFEIVQLGVINLDGEEVLNRYIRPYRSRITEGAAGVHGITNAALDEKGATSLITQYADVKAALEGKIIIAYNSPFDKAALENSLKLCGLEPIEVHSWRCAMRAYAKHNPSKADKRGKLGTNWKLTEAVAQQGLAVDENAHDALADVHMTLELIKSMVADEPSRWTGKSEASPAPTAKERPYQVDDEVKVKASGAIMIVKAIMPNGELNLALKDNPSQRQTMRSGAVELLNAAIPFPSAEELATVENAKPESDAAIEATNANLAIAEAIASIPETHATSIVVTEAMQQEKPIVVEKPVASLKAETSPDALSQLEEIIRALGSRDRAKAMLELFSEIVEEVFPA